MSTVILNLPLSGGGSGGGGAGDASAANQLVEIGQLQFLNNKLEDKALRYDRVSSTLSYLGEAVIGALNSDPVWRIKKIDTSAGVVITFSGSSYNKIWDDRGSLTYV